MRNLLSALGAGGVIVRSQYLGREEFGQANNAARQVLLVGLGLSTAMTALCVGLCRALLYVSRRKVGWPPGAAGGLTICQEWSIFIVSPAAF